jgi:multidrug efflux pump subunit AcrA (membrane-fusion protein)
MAETNKGDRIIQIILLLLVAGGIAASLLLKTGAGSGGGMTSAGGMPPSGAQRPATTQAAPGDAAGQQPATAQNAQAPAGQTSGSQRQGGGQKPAGAGAAFNGGASDAIAVEAVTLERSTVSQSIKVNGDVTAETAVEIYPDTGGRLIRRTINLGDSVRKGDVIAQVDPSVPGQNYSNSPVSSTISGTVIDLPYQVGATVSAQTAVATIGDLDDLVILTYIPERYISSLKSGLKARVGFDAYPEESFEAEIYEISPVMDTDTRTLSVKLRMTEKDERIRPGMFATMKLITKQSPQTIAVPSMAVFNYYGDQAVYVINEKGKAERRIVSTGLKSDADIEITEGLSEGERVITQGLSKITDGSAVRAVSLEEA